MARTIDFYRTESGRCLVEDFLDSLQPKEAQKVVWVLKLVQELDRVPSQYFKKLTGTEEIWECRVRSGSNTYRVFAFFSDPATLVLTHGYSKKTQKTDPRQIRKAEHFRRDHFTGKRGLS